MPYISPPPTVQSSRFLKLPGRLPAYSGVQNTTASAPAMALRNWSAAPGSGSRSSSGLNAGSSLSPSYSTAVTIRGVTSRMVRSAAVLADPPRVLPDTSRMCVRSATRASISFTRGEDGRNPLGNRTN